MSTAASSASPVVRSHSASSRSQHHHRRPSSSSDFPQRTRSVAVRPSNAAQPSSQPPQKHSHHRRQSSQSRSQTQTYDRPPPASKAVFDNLARRDRDAAKGSLPSPARRSSSSRERSQERAATADSASKKHQRNLSVQGHQRNSIDMATAPPATATEGTAAAAPPAPQPVASNTQPRRRTMITTPSGQWALGKTIGAGSMGKVKLAKNLETGEQVSLPQCGFWLSLAWTPLALPPPPWVTSFYMRGVGLTRGFRLPSKLSLDNRSKSIATSGRPNGPIAPRKFGPRVNRPLSAS